jgi:y4mF family transcriptional regulator
MTKSIEIPIEFHRFTAKTGKMTEPDELARIVRTHRKAAKLSQLQLAELAGVGKTVVFDIEKGKETVKLQTLRKILKALNIEMRFTSPLLHNQND